MSTKGSTEVEEGNWLQPAIVVGLAITEAALLYKLIAGQVATGSAELITAICIIGILLLLTGKVDGLESISLGKDGFRAVAQLERRATQLEREMADLIFLSMGDDAYGNLVKLAHGRFGGYEMPPHEGLETELYYLRNLGFVKLKDEIRAAGESIHRLPRDGRDKNLSDYIEATPRGKKFIELRESWSKTREEDRS